MSEIGTPGFGLVPNGVSAVTVTYQIAPPRTVAVHRNFFVIGDRVADRAAVRRAVARPDRKREEDRRRLLVPDRGETRAERVPGVRRGQALDPAGRRSRRCPRRSRSGNLARREVGLVERAPDLARDRPGRRSLRRLRSRSAARSTASPPAIRWGRPTPASPASTGSSSTSGPSATCRPPQTDTAHPRAPARTADEGPARDLSPGDRHRHRQLAAAARTRCSKTRSATR